MTRLPCTVVTDRGTRRVPERLLLLLHGHDADEHGLTAVGGLLDPAGHFLVASPRGSVEVPRPAPPHGAAWFATGPRGPEPTSVRRALDDLGDTIGALCAEHDLDPARTIVGGFSQGAAMALLLLLDAARTAPLAGVIALSGYLPDVDDLSIAWPTRVPVTMHHGTDDDVVPVELGRDTASTLAHHGVAVSAHEYAAGHQITLEALLDARAWLDHLRQQGEPVER